MDAEHDVIAGLLLEQIESGVIHLDGSGTLVFINRKAEQILKVCRRDVIGKRVDMLPLRTPIYRVLSEDSHDTPAEISIEGTVVSVRAVTLPGSGPCRGELFELRDITSEKREKRQREEFVAMMTHDLKSPLTVIMGYVQALVGEMPDKVDPSLHLFVREMDKSALKMLSMIEDVLDSYRLEVGLLQIDRHPCNVGSLLEGCVSDGEREAVVHGSTFSSDISADIPCLELDGKQIGRVFANLIGNAVKFTPRRGKIHLSGALRNGALLVEVSDSGIGIPADELPRIFNKYFRASVAQGFKGTGLGLTISKAIVEAHGGSINVESVVGKGSRFSVFLPLERAAPH
jgi:signal transduction histidine kinase